MTLEELHQIKDAILNAHTSLRLAKNDFKADITRIERDLKNIGMLLQKYIKLNNFEKKEGDNA